MDLEQSVDENTFDFFNSYSHYQSDQDEDYSEKEDLIQNKKYYQKDLCKPFEKNIPMTEVVHLLRDQESDYLGGFFGEPGASQPDSLVHIDHEPSMASLLPRKVLR